MKTLLISGCSFSIKFSDITDNIKDLFGVDNVINLSTRGASPSRQIRAVIEWIAQNGNPNMVILPVSYAHRFDLPIAKNFDNLHNLHYRSYWTMDPNSDEIRDEVDKDILKTFLKAGSVICKPEHTFFDKLFVELLTFQSFLQLNGIRHLIFDMCNNIDQLWINFLSIDEKNNSGYQPGMQKRKLIKDSKGIFNFLDFCGNAWIFDNSNKDDQNKMLEKEFGKDHAGITDETRGRIHHNGDNLLKLLKHLTKEGAIYG